MSWAFHITLAVREAPRGEIGGIVIRSKKTIATRQGNRIAENGSTDRISYDGLTERLKCVRGAEQTWAETGTINDRLRFFRLQASIKFEVINIVVETLGGFCNLRVGIQFQETGIS
jgi:hypothetical protein